MGIASERSSFVGFVVRGAGGAEEELATSIHAERRPDMISYRKLWQYKVTKQLDSGA
jgi:hypothetical protein